MKLKFDNDIASIQNLSSTDIVNIELEQILETGKKIPIAILVNSLIAILAFTLMWGQIPVNIVIGWSAILLFSIILRIFLLINYRKVTTETLSYWNNYFIATSFFAGLIWGVFSIIMEFYNQHLHGIEAFILGGIAAGGIVTNALIRWNYVVFLSALLVPPIIYLLLSGWNIHLLLALMYFLFMVIFIINAINYQQINFKNMALVLLTQKSKDLLQISQDEIQENNELMVHAQEIAHVGNWEWNMINNALFWSDEIYRIFGLKPQAFAATYEAFLNTVHHEDRQKLEEAIQKTIKNNTPYYLKHRIVLPDGSEHIVLERGTINKDEHGNNLSMSGTVQDITEQEIINDKLLLQAEILDSISDAIFVHSHNGNFMYVNDAACTTRGFSKNEFSKMGIEDLDALDLFTSDEYEQHREEIMKQINESGMATYEVYHRRKNQSPIPVEVRCRLVHKEDKSYFISIATDISKRKQMQEILEESELKYRSIVENSLVGVYISDIHGHFHYLNDAFVKIMEYDNVDELMRQNTEFLLKNPSDQERMFEILKEKGFVTNYELDMLTKNNKPITVLLSANFDGYKLSGIIIDISKEKNIQNQLSKLSTTLEQIDDIVTISNRSGIIEYVNNAFIRQTGYTREEVYGKKANILKSNQHDEFFYKKLWDTILAGQTYTNRIINRKKNGELYYEQKTITPLKDDNNIIIGFVSSAKDITHEMKIEQQLEIMAKTDNLTGILNRHSFQEKYEQEIERSKRYQKPLSLIMLDIDHFKQVNDTYGHTIGDKVLKHLVNTVKMDIRQSDVFARFGGEEFLILCPETNLEQAILLANKIKQKIETTDFEVAGNITSSFGVTQYIIGEEKENLFKRVDEALYNAKAHGRNRVEAK